MTVEPLDRRGEVVRRLRGSAAEQIATLPPDRSKAKKAARKKPKPSSAELDAAERADAKAEERHATERANIGSASERSDRSAGRWNRRDEQA